LYRARASRLPRGKHGVTENVLASLVDGAAYTPVSAARELLRRSLRSCSFALQGNKLSAYSLTTVAIQFKRIIGLSPADYRRCFGIAAD
jgi:hypothetical protein